MKRNASKLLHSIALQIVNISKFQNKINFFRTVVGFFHTDQIKCFASSDLCLYEMTALGSKKSSKEKPRNKYCRQYPPSV